MDIIEEMDKIRYFEDKGSNNAAMSNKPKKKSHSNKKCVCGGHSTNDGDKQYKGKQWQKHMHQ